MNASQSAFTLAYSWSPIIFTGGLFRDISSLGVPIIAITQALSTAGTLAGGILSGGNIRDFNQPLFTWRSLPGSTLWESEVSEFPFYTNQIAANAQIQRPLRVSMLGHCPATGENPFTIKVATFIALQKVIENHISLGGTFSVLTPSYFYTNCLLTNFVDVSSGETNQPQVSWQMDFMQPLLTFPNTSGELGQLIDVIANQGTIGTPGGAVQ